MAPPLKLVWLAISVVVLEEFGDDRSRLVIAVGHYDSEPRVSVEVSVDYVHAPRSHALQRMKGRFRRGATCSCRESIIAAVGPECRHASGSCAGGARAQH